MNRTALADAMVARLPEMSGEDIRVLADLLRILADCRGNSAQQRDEHQAALNTIHEVIEDAPLEVLRMDMETGELRPVDPWDTCDEDDSPPA